MPGRRALLAPICGLLLWVSMASPGVSWPVLALPLDQPGGSAIVFRCGNAFENLCRFTFDGSSVPLTSDGQPNGPLYASPSLSADGARLAFTFGNDVYIADRNAANRSAPFARRTVLVSLRPDGGRLATVETIPEVSSLNPTGGYYVCGHQLYGCIWNPQTPLPGFVDYLFTYDPASGAKNTERRAPRTFGWAGTRILSDNYDSTTKLFGVCLLVADDYKCERDVARDRQRSVLSPSVSPDGTSLAVTACAPGPTQEACSISLYALPGGTYVRDLTHGPDDSLPVWSPDSSQVAFTRGESIWVVGRDGGPNSEHLLIDHGITPSWARFAGAPATEPPQPPSSERPSAPAMAPGDQPSEPAPDTADPAG